MKCMLAVFNFLAFSMTLCNPTPLPEVAWKQRSSGAGNGESKANLGKVSSRGILDCPFSHPSGRGLDHITPVLRNLDVLKTSFGHSKRDLKLKTKYVDHSGRISPSLSGELQIRVDATEDVSDLALSIAAETIRKMTQHMSDDIFDTCAANTSVGLFTKEESMTVFPEYAHLAPPPGCGTSCEGSCETQCTFDGRPYSTLTGAADIRAVVLDDNVLCNEEDPFSGYDNILVHEYAHSVKLHCLTPDLTSSISSAYRNARENKLWTMTSYAMATEDEYWAVATTAIFNSGLSTDSAGGMNECGDDVCGTEVDASWNIYNRDPNLYILLMDVYFNNSITETAGLQSCTTLNLKI